MTRLYNWQNQKDFRKDLRRSMPKSEVVLWKRIRGSQLGYKFRRQHGIGKYIVDFFCPELRLAIEVDGITHEGSRMTKDDTRQKWIGTKGITILRFTSRQVLDESDYVVEMIFEKCRELGCNEGEDPHSFSPLVRGR